MFTSVIFVLRLIDIMNLFQRCYHMSEKQPALHISSQDIPEG